MVDLLLSPVIPHVAVPHQGCSWVGYTKIWNLLDYTAGIVPNVGVVDRKVDEREEYDGRNDIDKRNWDICMLCGPHYPRCKLIFEYLDDPELMHGHPIGLQVVGRRLEEEKVLAGMRVVGAVFSAE